MREAFLSRLAYERYLGYAEAQLRRMRANLGAGREINWKHAMHLIRLLIAGEALLREGRLTVPVGEYREPLLAVRRGERSWPEVEEWSEELKGALRRAYETTPLPEEPDRERVDAFLIRARQAMVDA